jgi:N-acyl homoserine lactone hydrolase
VGVDARQVKAVVNCHFHLDHCGGNPSFPKIPIFADRREFDAAHTMDYTLPSLIDFPGANLELHNGGARIAPGVEIVSTAGHSPGHQSLLVDTLDGRTLIAGQASNDASEFTRLRLAWEISQAGGEPVPDVPEWVRRVQDLDPRRILFSHDLAVWEPV